MELGLTPASDLLLKKSRFQTKISCVRTYAVRELVTFTQAWLWLGIRKKKSKTFPTVALFRNTTHAHYLRNVTDFSGVLRNLGRICCSHTVRVETARNYLFIMPYVNSRYVSPGKDVYSLSKVSCYSFITLEYTKYIVDTYNHVYCRPAHILFWEGYRSLDQPYSKRSTF